MPFARVTLLKGKSDEYIAAVSDSIHQALVDAFEVPPTDKFQAFHELEPGRLIFDRHYLGGPRSDDFLVIAISAGRPRTTATKQAFYKRLVELLAEKPGLRKEDVMVVISMSQREDWSFSNGEAQLLAGAPV
ncbi:Tautomerase enzyme [Mesorhizobium albiziae]|uniref:Tautomerase enzyme n=1 Tax=Neomesorhizobium albiziae TaxID=335020 RepID=A0A1I3YXU6_9HYPH|nr:tautomerase family protein [Mesorhizobium albiziae]GLS33233.1 tautomerase family protein [Mesorhizobium albiziae]SFK36169.1 Tautomerase enzyme [Mesorhizobium albiziae]